MKECNVVIDGRNFFDQPVKNNLKTYDNIRKIAIGLWLHDWLCNRLSQFQKIL